MKKEGLMRNLFASVLSFFGTLSAEAESQACSLIFFDEPECPKSLIK